MTNVNLDEITGKFFAIGYLQAPISDHFQEKLNSLEKYATTYKVGESGLFFHTSPFYLDMYSDQEMFWIKIGQLHDGTQLLSMEEIHRRGFVGHDGIKSELVHGNGVILGASKSVSQCFIYRNILAAPAINYWAQGGNFLAADNLRLLASLLDQPQLNDDILAEHYIYRAIYSKETYLADVANLVSGETLNWDSGKLDVSLVQSLDSMSEVADHKPIKPESVNWYFNQMAKLVGIYMEDKASTSASLLSGGFDSTFIQAAINQQPGQQQAYPSVSYVIDSPQFAFEVEYAQDAAQALGTKHTTYKISAGEYRQYLERTIGILGRPVPDDVRPCFQFLFDKLHAESRSIKYLYHGQLGDGLNGLPEGIQVIQGDKYRGWPIPVLDLAALLISPLSRSKAFGAKHAAATLKSAKDPGSPDNLLNSAGVYTDWSQVTRSFPESSIQAVFKSNHDLENYYSSSDWLIERIHNFDVITDSMHTISINYQMGLFSGIELLFPFADDLIIKSSYQFDPLIRYCHNHQIKPILRYGLQANVPSLDMDKPKGWSGMGPSFLFELMRAGELRDMVHAIKRPGFIDQRDFEHKIEQPDWFTFNLLTLDIFKNQVLN